MTDPAAFSRRILLAVTGLTPQIVTETLYALAVKGTPRWVPTGIRIITTRQGAEKAERMSLPAELRRLCGDYDLPEAAFGVEDIRIIKSPNGKPLDDILNEDDNAAVADFITEEVRELTADPVASLHVSIAGGRKTMGFYVGYALSLFGREQDRLSHVLVSPSLESSAFFYPRPGAADAQVHLGTIPFVRLRQELPDHLLQGRTPFSEAVAEAQKALPPPVLDLDPATRTVTAGSESFALEPAQFAFYWMMAERCAATRGGVQRGDPGLGEELLAFLRLLGDISEQTAKAYRNFNEENFDPAKTKVNAALKRKLGARRATPYLIGPLDTIPGTRIHRFGLGLRPEAVTIAASLRTRRVPAAESR
jgi:CRISPR-associated protein (TIGR02584 family)